MNKKIFTSVLFAVVALFANAASAVTYTNSVTDYATQSANARVGAGGPSVRANDLIVTAQTGGVSADIPAGSKIVVRLPDGLYFDGAPSYVVTTSSSDGLTLLDSIGDPTRGAPGTEQPAVGLSDTNGDGLMDRAEVTVGASGNLNDNLTISSNVRATAGATVGANKKASVIVNNGLAQSQNIVDVVASLSEPVQGASTTQLSSAQSSGQPNVPTLTPTILVTIPAGTAGSQTITIVPGSGITWATATTNASFMTRSPVTVAPVSFLNAVGAASGTNAITLVTACTGVGPTPCAATSQFDVQIEIQLDALNVSPGSTGARGVVIAGTAGVEGNANLVNVLPNGSAAALTSATGPGSIPGNMVVDIVKGSTAHQTLPAIDVTENFPGDAVGPGGTATLTITAGTGLAFAPMGSQTITVTGGTTSSITVTSVPATANNNVLTITYSARDGGKLVRISGVKATAASTASGNLSVTVGGATDKATAPKQAVVVANAVEVGTVSATLGDKAKKITGPTGSAGAVTSTITLTESTYGSLTRSAQSQVENAHFKVTPSTGATIQAITVTANMYPAGATLPAATCSKETGTSIAWICIVNAESTALTPGTSTISVAINYFGNSALPPPSPPAAVVGSTISMAFSGNAGVSGSVDVADVVISTELSRGTVPDLTPGDTEAQAMAKLTISELFTGAITTGNFRLIAPAGVTFNNAESVLTTVSPANAITATPTITATFSPNDTLVINIANATGTISFTPRAIVSPSASGFLAFQVVDGDINGAAGANITAESINLGYADGTLDSLEADVTDIDLNVGFQGTAAITGGLQAYKAPTSDDSAVATAKLVGNNVVITATGVGNATITVTDQLDAEETIDVTVTTGAAQTEIEKVVCGTGCDTDATFTSGASTDGGETFATEFTTADDVTIVGTINVDPVDQGVDGEVFVAVQTKTDDGVTLYYLNEDGQPELWAPLTLAGLGPHIVATPLSDVYNITVFSGNLAAGTHRVALAYATDGGDIIYAPKAIIITVTE